MRLHLTPIEAQILRPLLHRRGELVPFADVVPPPIRGGSDHPAARRRALRVWLCGIREKLRPAGWEVEVVKFRGVRLVGRV
jgi:hypothetical protein